MPAKSAAQQKAAGAALSAKRGETPKSKLRGASKSMEKSMSESQLEDFARVRRRTVDVLHAMPTEFWDREVFDPATGRLTMREAVGSVVRHELGHLSQLQSLVALLPVA